LLLIKGILDSGIISSKYVDKWMDG
jgi:hypothetical protein